MNYQEKTLYLSELFADYLGDCDCEPNGDGTFHLISWDEDIDEDLVNKVIEVIARDGYDIQGLQLREIPNPKIFSFSFHNENGEEERLFDIDCTDGHCRPSYVVWDEGVGFTIKDAISISEAIDKNEFVQKCEEMENKKNITGFTLLAAYDSKLDLIEFNSIKFQPQITILTILPDDNAVYNISLSPDEGFKIVTYINGHYTDYTGNEVQVLNAYLNYPDGTVYPISIQDAKDFILKNYDQFDKLKQPTGDRCYPCGEVVTTEKEVTMK